MKWWETWMYLKHVKDMREGKLSAFVCVCVCFCSILHYNRWNGLQQGGIKPERFLLYNKTCVYRQMPVQGVLCWHSHYIQQTGKQGKRRRMSYFGFVCDSLLQSKLHQLVAGLCDFWGGMKGNLETNKWTKQVRCFDLNLDSPVFTGFLKTQLRVKLLVVELKLIPFSLDNLDLQDQNLGTQVPVKSTSLQFTSHTVGISPWTQKTQQ